MKIKLKLKIHDRDWERVKEMVRRCAPYGGAKGKMRDRILGAMVKAEKKWEQKRGDGG